MPTPAADRQRLALVGVAVVSVGLAALSYRVLHAASAVAARTVPAGDLRPLTSYLAPLPETTSLDVPANGIRVVQADPFGAASVVSGSSSIPSTVSKPPSSPSWIVSSILFEESKRSAIVNDAWVNVGDSLPGGARLSAIERKYVVVTDARGNRLVVSIQGVRHEN